MASSGTRLIICCRCCCCCCGGNSGLLAVSCSSSRSMPVTEARCVSCRRQGRGRVELQVPIAEKKQRTKVRKERIREKKIWGLFRNQSRSPCLMHNATHATMQSPCDSPVSTHPNFATAILHNKKS